MQTTTSRPTRIDAGSFPPAMASVMQAAADRKWCWVTTDGRAFYVNDESKARASQQAEGGSVFAPVA